MLLRITHPEITLDHYSSLLPADLLEDLTRLAAEFQGMRFVHANSTAIGGGVAEILQSLVPLMNSLGVATERLVISPTEPKFFQVTKRIHNLLQGAEGSLSAEELEVYFRCIGEIAEDIQERKLEADVWFLHDPQLLPLASLLPRQAEELRYWVCHIDLTAPNPQVLEVLAPLTGHYDGLAFSLPDFVPAELDGETPVFITPPSIDPLTTKNMPMRREEALGIVAAMGVDPERPLITQVSRFDYWKDPWGVIDAYRQARQEAPGLQLALLGLSQAADDPEALDVLNSITEYAAGDPDIHSYFYPTDLPDTIDRIVNAFQTASLVVMQKSTREGFGLTVSEAMWKSRAVIGGNVGGIRVQIEDGVNGYLVDSPAECGRRIVQLLQSPELRESIGKAARERVRRDFLLPRLALDYLQAARAGLPELPRRYTNGANGYHPTAFDELEQLRISGSAVIQA